MSEPTKEIETTVFITVKGGLVQEIQSTKQGLDVFIIDLDRTDSTVPYVYKINTSLISILPAIQIDDDK